GIVAALPEIAAAARSSGAQSVLFTADSAGALPVLAQLLPDNRIAYPQFQFMGITQWNVPPATLQLRGLQDGWFTMPDPALIAQFEARFTAAFGQAPHPIAGLAYDGIAAIGALLGTGAPDALSRASLTQDSGFVGVNGVFRLMPDGTNQRGLALATIRNNAVVILEPAPRSFAGSGA
ncbi:MAG: ABC transporter substrate-binding protein, partial [Pararhodobacter sp.]|nr:ABC transporter substrate-binding protein [Pararhodobacter sp.]